MSSTNREPEKWWSRYISIEMLPSKATFFLCEGYLGSILPFLNMFYVSLLLTPTQAGFITGVGFAVATIASPLWSSLIETTGRRKSIFVVMCVAAALSVFSIPWLSASVASYTLNVTCHENITTNKEELKQRATDCTVSRTLTNPDLLFYSLLSIGIVSSLFFLTVPSFVNSVIVKVVKTRKQITTYGPQRVFAVIGFGFGSLISGVAVENYRSSSFSPFSAIFFMFLPCMLLLIPVGYILIDQIPKDEITTDDKNIDKNIDNIKDFSAQLISFLKKCDTVVLLLTVILSGVALNILSHFLVLFMTKDMHSPKFVVNAIFLTLMVTMVISLQASSKAIRLIGGPVTSIIIGFFSFVPRLLMMSYIENPWLAVPISLLGSLTHALFLTATIEYVYQISPKKIVLTTINIVATLYHVASSIIANIVGGMVYDMYGGRRLFRGMAFICGIWSAIIILYHGRKYLNSRGKTGDVEKGNPSCSGSMEETLK